MKTATQFVVIFLFGVASCRIPSRNRQATYSGIDTLSEISKLSIIDSLSAFRHLNDRLRNLSDTIDTLTLTYYAYACDCPSWVRHDTSIRSEIVRQDPFKYGYYLEAAGEDIRLQEQLMVSGNSVQFIGRKYLDARLPSGEQFTDPAPHPGSVFRYYAYKVIHPYNLWAPARFKEFDRLSGESLHVSPILTVK